MTPKTCIECGRPIPVPSNPKRIYCSTRCSQSKQHQLYRERNPASTLRCTADTGAVSEMLVTADLLKRGYEVFRAVSAGATCDMIALRNGTSLRIQVKTASRSTTGRVLHPKVRQAERHDHLAAVIVVENLIVYLPPIE